MEEARKRGLLVGKGGFYGNVVRMSPPLNISKADVDEAAQNSGRELFGTEAVSQSCPQIRQARRNPGPASDGHRLGRSKPCSMERNWYSERCAGVSHLPVQLFEVDVQ